MKKLLLAALIAIALVGLGVFFQNKKTITSAVKPSPDIGIFPARQDLGKVVYGNKAEANFTIINNTDQTVEITRVSTSCGCTRAFPEKKVLSAGEKINLKVTFDPAVHQDDSDLGNVVRIIYLDTNYPNFPRLTAAITARVVKSEFN